MKHFNLILLFVLLLIHPDNIFAQEDILQNINTLYKIDTVVYLNNTPIKIIPAENSVIEIFVFDLSLPKGQKRLLCDTIPANNNFKLDLNYLTIKSYWFGYRFLGNERIEMAQFTIH